MTIIEVNVSCNASSERKTILVTPETTIRQCFEEAGIAPANLKVMVGSEDVDDLDSTLSEYEVSSRMYVTAIRKAENA